MPQQFVAGYQRLDRVSNGWTCEADPMRAAAIFLGCLVVGVPGAAQGVADLSRLAENPSVRGLALDSRGEAGDDCRSGPAVQDSRA
jgi:hypothetical protein